VANNVARIQAELDLDSGKFHGSITSAIGAVKSFNQSLNSSTKSIQNIERRVTGLGASLRDTMVVLGQFRAALHTIWMFTGEWAASIVDAAAKLERLQMLMKGLSKATTEAGRTADALRDMNYVLEKAKNAPFTIDAIADSFVKLKAAGIDPTKGSLDALTDAVAHFGGTSETLHRATIAVQQMAGKGVISMEELRQQLGEAVPNAMQLMARGMGMSMQELVKQVSLGKVEATGALQRMFIEMRAEFQGSSSAMMTTWNGMTSKLKTDWMLFAQEIANGGLFDGAKRAVLDLSKFLNSPEGRQSARELGQALGEAAQMAGRLIRWLIDNRNEIMNWGKLLVELFAVNRIYDFGVALVKSGASLVEFIGTLGRMNTAMIASRVATVGWTGVLSAAAGPIGIAITAIAGLILWLNNQKDAAIRAGDAMQYYYDQTDRGSAVSPKEHAAMADRLAYLQRLKKAADDVQNSRRDAKAGGLNPQLHDEAVQDKLQSTLKEGRQYGIIQLDDVEIGLRTKEQQVTQAYRAFTANIGTMTKEMHKQSIVQVNQSINDSVDTFSSSVDVQLNKIDRESRRKLVQIQQRLDSDPKGYKAGYAKDRAAILGGAADAKRNALTASQDVIANQMDIAKANGRESEVRALTKLMDETNKKLLAVNDERDLLLSAPKMMSGKSGTGKGKKGIGPNDDTAGDDKLLNFIQTLKGKEAELQASVGDGIPKLEKFKELLEAGEYGANAKNGKRGGLVANAEALIESIDKLSKKAKDAQAIKDVMDQLSDVGARAGADVISARVKNVADLYGQVSAGMATFNRQLAVLHDRMTRAGATDGDLAKFDEQVKKIKKDVADTDFENFADFVKHTQWDTYVSSLVGAEKATAEFNHQTQDLNATLAQMVKDNPEREKEITALGESLRAAFTQKFNKDNQSGLHDWIDKWKDTTEEMRSYWGETMDGIAGNLADMFVTGKAGWRDFATNAIKQIERILISKAIAKLAEFVIGMFGGGGAGQYTGDGTGAGSMGQFGNMMSGGTFTTSANGNIMTAAGPLKLNKYANGGIAKSPQLSLFGEGRTPEAYVPLPDGRSIPVTMAGGGGGVVNSVSIQVTVQSNGKANSDVASDTAAGRELGKMLDAKVKSGIAEEMRQGGSIWKMVNGSR
jgi:lambda family phage tail tape measure protein